MKRSRTLKSVVELITAVLYCVKVLFFNWIISDFVTVKCCSQWSDWIMDWMTWIPNLLWGGHFLFTSTGINSHVTRFLCLLCSVLLLGCGWGVCCGSVHFTYNSFPPSENYCHSIHHLCINHYLCYVLCLLQEHVSIEF